MAAQKFATTLGEAAALLEGTLVQSGVSCADVKFSGVCTDTRELKAGQLFVALTGTSTWVCW